MSKKILTAAISAALLCGCVPEGGNINDNPNAGSQQDQYNALLQRPNIEQATDKYQRLLQDVKTTLKDRYDLPNWEYTDEQQVGAAGCGFDFPDVRSDQGITRTISGGFTRATIPPEKWRNAAQVVTQLANQYGFKGPERVANKPGQRVYNYYDATGTRFHLGQGKNLTVSISTGCFLTPEAHQRGGPLPSSSGY